MKKFIHFFVAMMFTFTCFSATTAFASTAETSEDAFITIEEYETALKKEAEKYNIECDVLSYDPSVKLTSKMLQDALHDLRFSAQNFEIRTSASNRVMPVKGTYYNEFVASCPPYGWATIRTEINATVDAQSSAVIEVTGKKAYQYGAFVNFDSWETDSITAATNNPKTGMVTATVKGLARFSYADPATSITTGITYGVNQDVEISCW